MERGFLPQRVCTYSLCYSAKAKLNMTKGGTGYSSVTQHMCGMHTALGLIPRTAEANEGTRTIKLFEEQDIGHGHRSQGLVSTVTHLAPGLGSATPCFLCGSWRSNSGPHTDL